MQMTSKSKLRSS